MLSYSSSQKAITNRSIRSHWSLGRPKRCAYLAALVRGVSGPASMKNIFILLLLFSSAAQACYVTKQTKEQVVAEAKEIFIGALQKAELVEKNPIYMRLRLTYKVIEGFKGKMGKTMVVYTAIDLAACGLGATGFYGEQLLFTGKKGQVSNSDSFSLSKKLTTSGWVYSKESMDWIAFLRGNTLTKQSTGLR